MLLDENPLIELTDEDATNLTRLLFASVRKAVGERIVPASDNRKQYFNKAQKVSKFFVSYPYSLPQLIQGFSYNIMFLCITSMVIFSALCCHSQRRLTLKLYFS